MARSQSTEAIIRISADESVSRTAKAMRAELEQTADSARKITSEGKKSGISYESALKGAKGLAVGLGAAAAAAAAAALAAKGLADNVRAAAQSEAVEAQFNAITKSAGGAADVMARLTQASAGGIDGTTRQQYAIQAQNAGLTIEQLSTLLEAANKSATATGRSQTEVSQQYVQSIADMSDGVFKASGLQVDMGQIVAKTTTELGISSDALSVNEKRQLLLATALSEVNRAYGDVRIDERITAVNRLDAEIANLTDTAQRWAAVQTIKVAEAFGVYESGATKTARLTGEIQNLTKWIEMGVTPAVEQSSGSILQGTKTIVTHADAVAETARRQERWEGQIRELTETLTTDREALDIWMRGLSQSAQAQQLLGGNVAGSTDAIRAWQDQIRFGHDTTTEAGRQAKEMALSLWDQAEALGQLTVLRAEEQRILAQAEVDRYERGKRLSEQARTDAINAARRAAAEAERIARLQDEAAERAAARRVERLAKGGGKGKSKGPKAATQSQLSTMDMYDALARGAAEDAARQAQARQDEIDDIIRATEQGAEQARVMASAWDNVDASMRRAADSSLGMAQGMANSFGGLGAAVANSSQIIVSQVDQISSVMDQFRDAGLSASEGFVKSVPGMLAAGGALTAGFISDTQTKAGIMGAFELAAAAASYPDFVGMATHGLAAGLYFAVAGGAFGGSGGGAGAGRGSAPQVRMPQVGVPSRDSEGSGNYSVTINMSGATIVGSDKRRLRSEFAAILAEAAPKGPARNFLPS